MRDPSDGSEGGGRGRSSARGKEEERIRFMDIRRELLHIRSESRVGS